MTFRKSLATTLVSAVCLWLPASGWAQGPPRDSTNEKSTSSTTAHSGMISTTHLIVYVREGAGGPISSLALVTLTRTTSQYIKQVTAQGGQASFDNLSTGRYTIQVIAPGYENSVEEIQLIGGGGGEVVYVTLKPESPGGEPVAVAPGPPVLAPKAQKELEKALEALRAGKLAEARTHLDAVSRVAPSHPDVNYLLGVYSSKVNDWQKAKSYWEKAIAIYPQHVFAQVSLAEELLRENKPAEAIPHLKKAIEIQPTSWRAHAFLADADLRLGSSEEAVRDAERAIEIGHERADAVRPILAEALVAQRKVSRAIQILESYLQEFPADAAAQTQLASLRTLAAAPPSQPSSAPAAPPVP